MALNPIQFQPCLSLPAFLKEYGTEEKCQAALFQHRWPEGVVCPDCGNNTGCRLSRGLYQCHRCHHQTSLTAGTIFHGTHLPLTTWFLDIYLLTQRKSGISALQLSRELGVAYNTAWKLKHKLQVMHERVTRERSSPDASRWMTTTSAVNGRESAGAALSTSSRLSPPCKRMEMAILSVFSCAVPAWQIRSSTGSIRCSVTSKTRSPSPVRTMPSAGSKQHAPRYLAEFEYRFNRRYDLKAMIPRFLAVAARTPPMPYRLLTMAEPYA